MKIIKVDGIKFNKDSKTGYYLSSKPVDGKRIRLHRYIWIKHNGPIPKGFDVHHKDEDKDNNEPDNFELLLSSDHQKLHGKDEKRKLIAAQNVVKFAVPAAKEWHRSEAGSEWHKKHYENYKHLLHRKTIKQCDYCGSTYETQDKSSARFCSNKCKSSFRRKSGVDNVDKVCTSCGNTYSGGKYNKSTTCSVECGKIKRAKTIEDRKNRKS